MDGYEGGWKGRSEYWVEWKVRGGISSPISCISTNIYDKASYFRTGENAYTAAIRTVAEILQDYDYGERTWTKEILLFKSLILELSQHSGSHYTIFLSYYSESTSEN